MDFIWYPIRNKDWSRATSHSVVHEAIYYSCVFRHFTFGWSLADNAWKPILVQACPDGFNHRWGDWLTFDHPLIYTGILK